MGLRTKLVAATLLFTFVLVTLLSAVFLVEVLRERVAQTEAANGVLLHQLLASTRSALQRGLSQESTSSEAGITFQGSVTRVLQQDADLQGTLHSLVRYSPDIQDVFISDASGQVIVSSTPLLLNHELPIRGSFPDPRDFSLVGMERLLLGVPETLDITLPLERNGQPFLMAHVGLRSTFLRDSYAPWLRAAVLVSLFAMAGSLLVAAGLSAAALRPIEQIERRLAALSGQPAEETRPTYREDAVERVSSTISRLDAQMRTSEQTQSQMATNLNSMLYALKDGVLLFTEDLHLVTASDAVSNFLTHARKPVAGQAMQDIFERNSILGGLLGAAMRSCAANYDELIEIEDGRRIQVTVDRGAGNGTGALVTLHDVAAEQEFGRELQVSQRLASIGRLMTGVGHEVKNPINAMVVHLELLRSKLGTSTTMQAAQRHVDVLSSEMHRLDRVVQTLADFSRPIEPVMEEQAILPVINAVIALIADDAAAQQITVQLYDASAPGVSRVRCDSELLRQAILNIALNAMQAMPEGGTLEFQVRRDRQALELKISDTGTGIAPDVLNRIFDLYFTTKPLGSGIGLAMTYRIVQMHGGLVQVESETSADSPHRGTRFTIRLPLVTRAAQTVVAT